MSPKSVYDLFAHTALVHRDRPFINVLPETAAIYEIQAGEISYSRMMAAVEALTEAYRDRGYGPGHRVGLLVENRPAFFEHWFALNGLGVSVVPINPDLKRDDMAYVIGHSEQCLTVALPTRIDDIRTAADAAGTSARVIGLGDPIPTAPTPMTPSDIAPDSEAALLYTSGTTGNPKGCVLSNRYFWLCGEWYKTVGGLCELNPDGERMLTPLPLFHMNAMACSVMAMIAVGGCLTVLDRFHPGTWWESVRAADATIVHYLGVMPPLLMAAPSTTIEWDHSVRFGFGAGVDRKLHHPFEERFGFPLIEAWAMTETGNGAVVAATHEPRHVGTNCFGRPDPTAVEIRIVGDDGIPVGWGDAGELLVRRVGDDPQFGFFTRYLKDPAATEEAWRDGWFHTGDVVRETEDGSLIFVDRKKNVIRRSGENIAAVEVETVLGQHDAVKSVAVCAVPDDVRGDEVFALVVTDPEPHGGDRLSLASDLVQWSLERLAYYKAPGYVAFVQDLPLTATNKLQRGSLKPLAVDQIARGYAIDTRGRKKRDAA